MARPRVLFDMGKKMLSKHKRTGGGMEGKIVRC